MSGTREYARDLIFLSSAAQHLPKQAWQYLLVAAEPYETIAFKIPSREIDKADGMSLSIPSLTNLCIIWCTAATDEELYEPHVSWACSRRCVSGATRAILLSALMCEDWPHVCFAQGFRVYSRSAHISRVAPSGPFCLE